MIEGNVVARSPTGKLLNKYADNQLFNDTGNGSLLFHDENQRLLVSYCRRKGVYDSLGSFHCASKGEDVLPSINISHIQTGKLLARITYARNEPVPLGTNLEPVHIHGAERLHDGCERVVEEAPAKRSKVRRSTSPKKKAVTNAARTRATPKVSPEQCRAICSTNKQCTNNCRPGFGLCQVHLNILCGPAMSKYVFPKEDQPLSLDEPMHYASCGPLEGVTAIHYDEKRNTIYTGNQRGQLHAWSFSDNKRFSAKGSESQPSGIVHGNDS